MQKISKYLFPIALIVLLSSCGGAKKASQNKNLTKKSSADRLPEPLRLQFDSYFFQAEKEKALGHPLEAIAYYEKALEIDSLNDAAYFNIANIYLSQGNNGDAFLYLSKATEIEKSNLYYFTSLAEAASRIGKHQESIKAYKQAINLNPGDPELYFELANQHIYLKAYPSAIDVYDQMEEKFGVGEELVRQKEQLYISMGKPDMAIAEVKKLVAEAPAEPRYLGLLAELYQQVGKIEEAKALYAQILKVSPGNGFAYFGLAELYRKAQNMDSMLYSLNLAFQDPSIDAQNKLGVIMNLIPVIEQDPSYKKPIFGLAETVQKTHPGNAAVDALLGDLHFADGHKNIALRYYEKAIENDPNEFRIWRQVLSMYEENGENEKCVEAGTKALEYFPNQLILYYFTASAHMRLKNYEKVVEVSELGVNMILPGKDINAILYSFIGDAQHQLNNNEKAYKAYDESLELDPENLYVLNNYAYYLSLEKKNLAKAEKMSKKTIDREPDNASYLDTYGWILYQKGDYKNAKIYIEKALDLSEESSEVLEHLGDVLYKLGDKTGAKAAWERALKISPASTILKDKVAGQVNL